MELELLVFVDILELDPEVVLLMLVVELVVLLEPVVVMLPVEEVFPEVELLALLVG